MVFENWTEPLIEFNSVYEPWTSILVIINANNEIGLNLSSVVQFPFLLWLSRAFFLFFLVFDEVKSPCTLHVSLFLIQCCRSWSWNTSMIFEGFWLDFFLLWQRQHTHHHHLITGFTKIMCKTLSLLQSLHHQLKELISVSEAVTLWGFLPLQFWYYYGSNYYMVV